MGKRVKLPDLWDKRDFKFSEDVTEVKPFSNKWNTGRGTKRYTKRSSKHARQRGG